MQYLIPAIISASGLIANAAPVAKGHDGIQPMTPPATYVGGKLVVQWNPDVSGEWKDTVSYTHLTLPTKRIV